MGLCLSSESTEDAEQKKRSQMIDRKLEEDSRRLRRECKILLLGKLSQIAGKASSPERGLTLFHRLRGKWQVDHCETDENHSPKWLHR